MLLGRDRHDRHRRDRLGGEHQPPARPAARRCPGPTDRELAFFVREAWPSSVTATTLTAGRIRRAEALTIICEMSEGGDVFGDGIEADRVAGRLGPADEIGAASRS